VTGIDGRLVGRDGLPVPALPLVQVPEVARRDRRVLAVTVVGRLPVGLLGAFDVAVPAQQQAQAERGGRGVLGSAESIASWKADRAPSTSP